ncbi:MAG: hypothetical protein K0V04_40385 [Deltaproteobacteria bacterium]|nr:hypothetical protein [Deltaproteobacteria bacterium]
MNPPDPRWTLVSIAALLGSLGVACDVTEDDQQAIQAEILAAEVARAAGVDDYEVALIDEQSAPNEPVDAQSLDRLTSSDEPMQLPCQPKLIQGTSCMTCLVDLPNFGCAALGIDCGNGIYVFTGC